MTNPAVNRVLKDSHPDLLRTLTAMPPADLNSLLLEVFREHTKTKIPADVMRSYKHNRFVRPSGIDPISFAEEEIKLMKKARSHGFDVLELSPVAPLGSCSHGFTDQNKIISALRGTEVVSDATNLLALESTLRRENSRPASTVHLCTCHRHVRAQSFQDERFTAHFKVFCALSHGRDVGNFELQSGIISHHLKLYADYFAGFSENFKVVFTIKILEPESSDSAVSVNNKLRNELNDMKGKLQFVHADAMEHRYYNKVRISIDAEFGSSRVNIGDCGFVDWGARLCSDRKEIMFASAIGTELLWNIHNRHR